MQRLDNRKNNELREVSIIPDFNIHAEGSALIKFGNTHVICNASIDKAVPRWMQDKKTGWITAEYGMLPRSTNERMNREAQRGKQSGRTMEIQRLIGRSLRQVVNLDQLTGYTITIDCDVIQADGGTRTASITGGTIALCKALQKIGKESAINNLVAAVSVGIFKDELVLDLNYEEDSNAECDVNIVMNDNMDFIEIQGTGEEKAFSKEQFNGLMDLAEQGIFDLFKLQNQIINHK
ncbi:MAG: ribonuclease PH [Gammaproteobacteria bacterium]|jgi:ribonuclease PH|nr:ribonuclease PH [Gammaproteobacteria bacterium]|tara:strand:- start:792 stop:1499 length:708 start_codon:yes stop_codon:yes gene_type:complete